MKPTRPEFDPTRPGSGTSGTEICTHKFVFLRTAKWTDDAGGYNTRFIRVDTFFCEKCLEQKEVRKEDFARDTPDWYREGKQ